MGKIECPACGKKVDIKSGIAQIVVTLDVHIQGVKVQ